MIIEIDARGLQPPEPYERVVSAIETFKPGDEIVLLLHREPQPLFSMLARNGYRYSVTHRDDGTVCIRIS
jgi:uncharacterized protein (DUF2249 family)